MKPGTAFLLGLLAAGVVVLATTPAPLTPAERRRRWELARRRAAEKGIRVLPGRVVRDKPGAT